MPAASRRERIERGHKDVVLLTVARSKYLDPARAPRAGMRILEKLAATTSLNRRRRRQTGLVDTYRLRVTIAAWPALDDPRRRAR